MNTITSKEFDNDIIKSQIKNENKMITETTTNSVANLHAIGHVSNLVSIQIDHYQYLFLLRLSEDLQELTTFLSLDAERISQMVNDLINYSKIIFLNKTNKILIFIFILIKGKN